ncbi:MAG TPA: class I SAM-dependent methyltransferase [Burkholderiales bacterium]|nr:class I SAM-dependent methyltransferase [Burkholderiales bacterium]
MKVLAWIEDLAADLETIGRQPPPAPRWNQDWFPRLDAAAAYAIVRNTRPRRILEVGSGHSTRFLARAVADGGLQTQITAIDPEPRASIDGLAVTCLRLPVQSAPPELFDALREGDVLFIDSSHQVKAGSDVEFLLERALPRLASGVRLHFHDIFLPDDYPTDWEWRRYNEQQAVAALLAGGYRQEFSSHQARKGALNGVLARLPLVPGARESSLWLRKL